MNLDAENLNLASKLKRFKKSRSMSLPSTELEQIAFENINPSQENQANAQQPLLLVQKED